MANWQQTSAPSAQWKDIASSSSGQFLAAVIQFGQIYTSQNYGGTWTLTNAPSANWFSIASNSSGQYLAAVIQEGEIYTSQNYGGIWTKYDDAPIANWVSIVSDSSGDYLAAVAFNDKIYTSQNHGTTWTGQSNTPNGDWFSIASSSSGQNLAAISYTGKICTSPDGGLNWAIKFNGSSGWNNIASSSSGQFLAAVFLQNEIYTSQNYGETWLQRSPGHTNSLNGIASDSTGKFLAVITEVEGIYTSEDYGVTWTKSNVPNSQWRSIASDSTGQFLVAGVSSGGIYSTYTPPPPPPACFKEDTKILTNYGYIPIQDLRNGDLIKTLKNEYKTIEMIGKSEVYHPASEDRSVDQLYRCNHLEVFEDLIITGSHSILVDDISSYEQQIIKVNGDIYVTEGKYRFPACLDKLTTVYEIPGTYTIYHLALENANYYSNYGIYANGLLVETCSKRYLKENMKLKENIMLVE